MGPKTGPLALQSYAKAALDTELGTCPPSISLLFKGPQTSIRVRAEDPRLRATTGNCFHFCPLPRVWSEHRCRSPEPLPKDGSYTTRSARGVRPVCLLTLRAAAKDRGCFPTCGPQGQAEEQAERREQSWDSRPAWDGRGEEVNILAHVALGGGVEGRKLHVAGVLAPHLIKHFLKGVEPTVSRVHVVLIYLQGEHDRALSSSGRPGQVQAVAESSQGSTPHEPVGQR